MNPGTKAVVGERVTKSILSTIHQQLAEPDFDEDAGEIKLIDQDDACLYYGLFEPESTSGKPGTEPSIIWTVEVFADLNGGR